MINIVGARPQFIKVAMVAKALRCIPNITNILVHTGQHQDDSMNQIVSVELGTPESGCNSGIGGCANGQSDDVG